MAYLNYIFFRIINFLIGLLPFGALHRFSNFVAFLLEKVLKYREEVVIKNLKIIQPKISVSEIHQTKKKFYRNLADLFLESIKGNSMTPMQVLKRYKYKNPEFLKAIYNNHQSMILAPGHFNNWEWASVTMAFASDFQLVAVYKQISNSYIDQYIRKNRSRKGFLMVPLHETKKTFEAYADTKTIFGLVGDQSPSSIKKAIWLKFFNQDTACLHGIAHYSKLHNYPIIFAYPKRVGRSQYEIEFEMLIEQPSLYSHQEIIQKYMTRLEGLIRQEPENWILSHKRWKHKKDGRKVTS